MTAADDELKQAIERAAAELGGTVQWNGLGTSPLERLRDAALTTDQLKAMPQPRWVIEKVLQVDSLAELYGRPGCHKSFIAADWALSITAGLAWRGLRVSAGPVVYIAAEGATGMGGRVAAWETHHAAVLNGSRHPTIWVPRAVQLGSAEWGAAVGDFAAEVGAELVIFDTRARNTVGLEENAARDMGLVVANLDLARERSHACMLLVHHANAPGDRPRGSTAVEGAADTELAVKVADGITTLKLAKQKNGEDGTEWKLRPVRVPPSIVLETVDDSPTTVTDAGLAMMDTLKAIFVGVPVSATRWLEASEVPKPTFYRQLKVLADDGLIRKQRQGKRVEYWPATEGLEL